MIIVTTLKNKEQNAIKQLFFTFLYRPLYVFLKYHRNLVVSSMR